MTTTVLFMQVTSGDYEISKYSIARILDQFKNDRNINLIVYCECLNEELENTLVTLFGSSPAFSLISSTGRRGAKSGNSALSTDDQAPHQDVCPNSSQREWCADVWTRELPKIDAEFVGIIDADFEILKGEFIYVILDEMKSNPRVGFYSSDFSETEIKFDLNSQKNIILQSRYHTPFCVYRRSALKDYCNFAEVEIYVDGDLHIYDCSAKMQEILISQYNYIGRALDRKFRKQYIHFGAFSHNKSLKGWRLKVYRLIDIGQTTGWSYVHGLRLLTLLVRAIFRILYKISMSRFDGERTMNYKYRW